jgi:hypothetical protein
MGGVEVLAREAAFDAGSSLAGHVFDLFQVLDGKNRPWMSVLLLCQLPVRLSYHARPHPELGKRRRWRLTCQTP